MFERTGCRASRITAPAIRKRELIVDLLNMLDARVPIDRIAGMFKVPVIGLQIANRDNNQQAANENLRLQNLWDGIETYAAMLTSLDW